MAEITQISLEGKENAAPLNPLKSAREVVPGRFSSLFLPSVQLSLPTFSPHYWKERTVELLSHFIGDRMRHTALMTEGVVRRSI